MAQSSRLNLKVDKIQKDVVTLKCGFDSLKDTKTAAAVESFERSCGRSGWRKVIDLDFSDNSTDCPSNWTQD